LIGYWLLVIGYWLLVPAALGGSVGMPSRNDTIGQTFGVYSTLKSVSLTAMMKIPSTSTNPPRIYFAFSLFPMRLFLLISLFITALLACQPASNHRTLPILGERDLSPSGDTIYRSVPDFRFIDQDSQVVTNATFAGKLYVVDFFFIHCPTICPKVKKNGLRIYEKYKNDDRVLMLSHSIDVRNDTVAALKSHARKLGIETSKWHLVTGDHDAIYSIADDYFSVATEDPDSPGGFDHSGRIILVDKDRHMRAFCDGTKAEEVDRFMRDIDELLAEQFK